MKELVEKSAPDVETAVVCPQGISAPTRQLIRNAGLDLPLETTSGEIGVAVLVDTNNLSQLGPDVVKSVTQLNSPIVVVDHHHKHPEMIKLAALEIVDETASSAAEIAAQLYKIAGKKLESRIAQALLAAIFVETRSFALANSKTFENAAYLTLSGAEPKRVPDLISAPPTRAERLARLKAASRINLSAIGDWLIVTSEVGSYQSSVARAIVSVGADLAIVAGKMKMTTVRVSMRATEKFHRVTGVHLARDITIPTAARMGGSGGGHPTAAGMTVQGNVDDALNACLENLKERLHKSTGSVLK